MKTLKTFFAVTLFFLISTSSAFSQFMPPSPVKAPIFEALSGKWTSEPYEMMGSKMTDEVSQNVILNGQFFQVNVKSVSSGFTYEGMVMIAPAEDGTLTGWGFDIFGSKAVTKYTGTWNEKMVSVDGLSSWGTESRIIALEGNVMTQNVSFKMKDEKGNEMPETVITVTYNK